MDPSPAAVADGAESDFVPDWSRSPSTVTTTSGGTVVDDAATIGETQLVREVTATSWCAGYGLLDRIAQIRRTLMELSRWRKRDDAVIQRGRQVLSRTKSKARNIGVTFERLKQLPRSGLSPIATGSAPGSADGVPGSLSSMPSTLTVVRPKVVLKPNDLALPICARLTLRRARELGLPPLPAPTSWMGTYGGVVKSMVDVTLKFKWVRSLQPRQPMCRPPARLLIGKASCSVRPQLLSPPPPAKRPCQLLPERKWAPVPIAMSKGQAGLKEREGEFFKGVFAAVTRSKQEGLFDFDEDDESLGDD